jgi:hypothetical protein
VVPVEHGRYRDDMASLTARGRLPTLTTRALSRRDFLYATRLESVASDGGSQAGPDGAAINACVRAMLFWRAQSWERQMDWKPFVIADPATRVGYVVDGEFVDLQCLYANQRILFIPLHGEVPADRRFGRPPKPRASAVEQYSP